MGVPEASVDVPASVDQFTDFTWGGISKVLSVEDIEDIVAFFYRKILNSDHKPVTVLDSDYGIWTLGAKEHATCQ